MANGEGQEEESGMVQSRDPDALSQALAEPSRRAILENLRLGQKSVSELVAATGLKQPNVSNHLARMRQQGIVRAERLGRNVYYSIALPVAELLLRLYETTANPLLSPDLTQSSASSLAAQAGARPTFPTGLFASTASPPQPTVEAWRQAFFRIILAGEEDRAHALVNDLLAHRVDLQTIYLDVFEWAMHRVGESYVQGETDEAHEHMASQITDRMMGRVAHFYTPVARRPYRALLGGVAGNRHVLGLRMLSDGLRTLGWETLFLGPDVPTASFLATAKSERPDLIVMTCMLEEHWEALDFLLRQLRAAQQEQPWLHYRLAAGGQFLNQNPQALLNLPIDFSAPTLHEFIETVNHLYPLPLPLEK